MTATTFFLNKTYLKEHQNAAQQRKSDVPGSSHIEKILKFIETHYKIRELFSLSMCTASVVSRLQNIVRFVLTKVGQVLFQ